MKTDKELSNNNNSIFHYILTIFKEEMKRMFHDIFGNDTEARKQQTANMLTFSRLIFSIIGMIGIIINTPLSLIFTIVSLSLGFTTDVLDGLAARNWGNSSNTELNNKIINEHLGADSFGAILDSSVDKSSSVLIGVPLAIANPLFIIPICGEAVISGINIIYKKIYPEIKIETTTVGKIKEFALKPGFILGIILLLFKSMTGIQAIQIESLSEIVLHLFKSMTVIQAIQIKSLSEIVSSLETATDVGIVFTALWQAITIIIYVNQNEKRISKINTSQNPIGIEAPKEVKSRNRDKEYKPTITKQQSFKQSPTTYTPIKPRGQIVEQKGRNHGRQVRARTRDNY